MAIDPSMLGGLAPAQGVAATQPIAPPQAGPPNAAEAAGPPAGVPPGALPPGAAPAAPPKKPPSVVPAEVARQLANALKTTKLAAGRNLAEYLGSPRGNVNVKDADLLRVWRKRDPKVDPLVEKLINHRSDQDIMMMMYPYRRALIRYGRRTYTEQVEFAEKMARLDADPRFHNLDNNDTEDDYEPPQSKNPSRGEDNRDDGEEMIPESE